ncbi:hypothetical protein DSAG12_02790 [Promethearchaeum syntrophicum]|uniref:Uncharacterized protein n=1 Tax=Promethearchaeum syntrophicum TaxID=2594042 RepID=A0A5B9DCD5_9ARCH|nr:hypothetical protein [Candidatus Prometheoarchaeum syntrophicum]QEE16959.1 hypothetical protein DSAG12_02790 [Candidatus Prometheoarchaeum syntrophicum]
MLYVYDTEGNLATRQVEITVEINPADVINAGSFSGIAIGTISHIFLIGAFVGIYKIKKNGK